MSREVRRVRDCPYRLGPGHLWTQEGYARYRCVLQGFPCRLRGGLRLSSCPRYRRYMSPGRSPCPRGGSRIYGRGDDGVMAGESGPKS